MRFYFIKLLLPFTNYNNIEQKKEDGKYISLNAKILGLSDKLKSN